MSPRIRPPFVLSVLLIAAAAAAVSCGAFKAPQDPEAGRRRLVVYSPHPAELIAAVVKEFRQRTGIEATVVSAGTGELIDRMRSPAVDEGLRADVLWGGGAESLDAVRDLFVPYRSREAEAVPAELKDPEGRWTGFSLVPIVIIYNEALVPPSEAPRSWRDLARPFFKGRVAFADPARSGSAYTALATMLRALSVPVSGAADGLPGSAESWAFADALIAAIGGEPVAESERVYGGVAAGEWFAGISFESAALSLRAAGAGIGIVYPAEGTSAVPDGVAVAASARNRAEAEAFVDFVLGRDVQGVVAERWFRRSVRTDAAPPPGVPPLSALKTVPYERSTAGREKDRVLAEWRRRLELATSRP
jgi:iron(III) transport system substrate-binding protein